MSMKCKSAAIDDDIRCQKHTHISQMCIHEWHTSRSVVQYGSQNGRAKQGRQRLSGPLNTLATAHGSDENGTKTEKYVHKSTKWWAINKENILIHFNITNVSIKVDGHSRFMHACCVRWIWAACILDTVYHTSTLYVDLFGAYIISTYSSAVAAHTHTNTGFRVSYFPQSLYPIIAHFFHPIGPTANVHTRSFPLTWTFGGSGGVHSRKTYIFHITYGLIWIQIH